ncbi:MAG TPA: hypothetical protein VET85_07555 [Stellaceae bacterium]|nr:hypothetical protein [Stellaceae bacterium]
MIGRVKIQCVNTDKVVDTGYGMDRAFFDDAPLDRNSLVCPACGQVHVWSKRQAWFEETGRSDPRKAPAQG